MDSYITKHIYYLNMQELKKISDKLKIPTQILIEREKGVFTKSGEIDRKGIIIKRILRYLKDGVIGKPTIYVKDVINETPLQNPTKTTKIYWGQFNSTNKQLTALLKRLTDGQFRHGANSFILIRKLWAHGSPPTLEEYARKWLALNKKPQSHPEWAYLEDLKNNNNIQDWKKYRKNIAIKVLKKILPYSP